MIGTPPTLPTMMPTGGDAMQSFLDAVNVASMGQRKPYVQGGLG